MGREWPRILITTSKDPAEQSRTFSKALRHVLPNALIINRGNYSRKELHIKSMQELCDYIYIVYSRENTVDKLVIYKIYSDTILQEGKILKFHQYIDHKIYGFHSIPENGPLSTSLQARVHNRELVDYLERYWCLELGKKNSLWLALDPAEHKKTTYISFIDALTQKKFFYAEVELLSGDAD